MEGIENVQFIIDWYKEYLPVPGKGKSITEVLKADPATLTSEDMARVSTEMAVLVYSTINNGRDNVFSVSLASSS